MIYPARNHVQKTFEELFKLLPSNEREKPQILLLSGGVTEFRNDTDREIIFRQESNFFYLTGCHVPGSYLLATAVHGTSLHKEPATTLFIPKAEEADIMWSVPPPSLEDAEATHDAARLDHPTNIPATIDQLIKSFPGALFHTLPKDDLRFPQINEEYVAAVLKHIDDDQGSAITDAYLLDALHRARLVKDEYEVDLIRKANAISSRAHETVMRVLGQAVQGKIKRLEEVKGGAERPLLPSEWLIETEGQAEAIFVASCRREESIHQAYPPIVAASHRSSTLHYCCNDKAFAWGPIKAHDHLNRNALTNRDYDPQVLLIDAGCEWNCYASDITRTMPIGNGGKFSPHARAIYELVLEMQNAAFGLVKPGAHWDDVHFICHQVLVRGFQRLGIFKSGAEHTEETILGSGITAAFFPHGLGHSIGLDVHDVPSTSKPPVHLNKTIPGNSVSHEPLFRYLRLRLPLEKNMVVTVEPGVYFHTHLVAPVRNSAHINLEVLEQYEGMGGVRIEDVVRITDVGYENLTIVRSDVDWVEGVCSGEL